MTDREIPDWAWARAAKRKAEFERKRTNSAYMGGEVWFTASVLVSPSDALAELERDDVAEEMVEQLRRSCRIEARFGSADAARMYEAAADVVEQQQAKFERLKSASLKVTDEMVGRAWGAYCNELAQGRTLVPVDELSELSLTINGMRRILDAVFAARKKTNVPD